jgi:biotin-(acetyl-CoA carboxylase) ligase
MKPTLIRLRRVDSTQSFLERHPELGVCAVLADCQLAGRGRRGNGWESRPGAGLWLSAALPQPPVPPGLVLQRAMLAVLETLEPWGAPLGLKWPNDLVGWRGAGQGRRLVKLGGIIGQGKGDRVILGVGVNLAEAPDLPERAIPPGCLAGLAPGQVGPDVETLALEILGAWQDLTVAREPAFRWPAPGDRIRWEEGHGICLGWLEDGRLEVRTAAGTEALSVADVSGLAAAESDGQASSGSILK